jgi:hypothetical protein
MEGKSEIKEVLLTKLSYIKSRKSGDQDRYRAWRR